MNNDVCCRGEEFGWCTPTLPISTDGLKDQESNAGHKRAFERTWNHDSSSENERRLSEKEARKRKTQYEPKRNTAQKPIRRFNGVRILTDSDIINYDPRGGRKTLSTCKRQRGDSLRGLCSKEIRNRSENYGLSPENRGNLSKLSGKECRPWRAVSHAGSNPAEGLIN